MRGSPQQEAGQRLVPYKVAPEKEDLLGSGLRVSAQCRGFWGPGWPLCARAGEERGAGPVSVWDFPC